MPADNPAGELTVTATAAPGLGITINGETASSDVPMALPDIAPGSEIQIQVSELQGEPPLSTSYTLVYLPSDFPELTVTVCEPETSSDPIYVTLHAERVNYLAKLDNHGVPYFYASTPQRAFDFKLHPTGELSYALAVEGNTHAEHVLLDASYAEMARIRTTDLQSTDVHDFLVEPNGNYILMAYEPTQRDLSAYGLSEAQRVLDGVVQELDSDLNVVFQWNTWDHMAYEENFLSSDDDYAHLNSVFVDWDGNWLVSSRGMSQVLKIDRTTGEVIWRLGGIANDFSFVNDPFEGVCGQHAASRLNNGNLLIFDNGTQRMCVPDTPPRGNDTRIVEYALDEDRMTAELVWSYQRDDVYSQGMGSAQRLENGNTFIGWGSIAWDNTEALATEVDAEGNVVFDLEAYSPNGAVTSYRAWRFSD